MQIHKDMRMEDSYT